MRKRKGFLIPACMTAAEIHASCPQTAPCLGIHCPNLPPSVSWLPLTSTALAWPAWAIGTCEEPPPICTGSPTDYSSGTPYVVLHRDLWQQIARSTAIHPQQDWDRRLLETNGKSWSQLDHDLCDPDYLWCCQSTQNLSKKVPDISYSLNLKCTTTFLKHHDKSPSYQSIWYHIIPYDKWNRLCKRSSSKTKHVTGLLHLILGYKFSLFAQVDLWLQQEISFLLSKWSGVCFGIPGNSAGVCMSISGDECMRNDKLEDKIQRWVKDCIASAGEKLIEKEKEENKSIVWTSWAETIG